MTGTRNGAMPTAALRRTPATLSKSWRCTDVLSENGFIVEVREDTLSARAEELSASEALELLAILGYLLIHTRQMDAALSGEDSRVAFADTLRKGIAQVLKECVIK